MSTTKPVTIHKATQWLILLLNHSANEIICFKKKVIPPLNIIWNYRKNSASNREGMIWSRIRILVVTDKLAFAFFSLYKLWKSQLHSTKLHKFLYRLSCWCVLSENILQGPSPVPCVCNAGGSNTDQKNHFELALSSW